MSKTMKRWVLAGTVLLGIVPLGMGGCGGDEVVVWLHVKNVSAELATLQVALMLDGKPATQQYEFSQRLGEVAIKLRKEQLGQGLLSVNLTGLTSGRCKVATGKYDAALSVDKPLAEGDVTLTTMSPARCLVSVEKVGDGSVTSSPAGVSCGTSCTMEVAMGTKVTFTGTIATPFTQSYWDGCTPLNDSCEVTVMQAQKVSVQWGPEARSKLLKVPKGSFTIGSPTAEPGRGSDETQHAVTLTTDFWMAESEVTQRQYRNLMGSSPSSFNGNDLPVEGVNWFDAVAYCNALSVKEKLTPCYQINGTMVGWADGLKCTGYRLPTDAEWEYAANPASPPRTVYAGSDTVDGVAWSGTNSGGTTHAVKTKTGNGRGLNDLSGNVWEWVWDFYQANYEALPSSDPIGPSTGTERVVRGGSWGDPATNARVAERNSNAPTGRTMYIGFRVVRSVP